jgi:hypothetical protein
MQGQHGDVKLLGKHIFKDVPKAKTEEEILDDLDEMQER